MKIKKLRIENFRGIRFLDTEMGDSLNLFVGVNGAGKTTVVDAIAILFSWMNSRIKSRKGTGIRLKDSDISKGEKVCKLSVWLDNGCSWTVAKTKSTVRTGAIESSSFVELNEMADNIVRRYEESEQKTNLPFCMVYGVNRLVAEVPMRLARHDILSPIHIYDDISSSPINFRRMFEWLRDRSDIENENRLQMSDYNDPQLDTVRRALLITLPEYGELKVKRNPRSLVMEKDGEAFDFQQLSDGEKCYISLIADIAKSLAMASPCAENPLETSNIIVIDEIELHMHVKWQSMALDKLRRSFPNCQFVITSHSPHILINAKTAENDKLVLLRDGRMEEFDGNTYNLTIKKALSEVFGIEGSMYNNEIKEHLNKIWSLFREETLNIAEIRNQYSWLSQTLDPNDQELMIINVHLRRNHIEL